MAQLKAEDIILEVRNKAKQRLGQIAPQDIKNLEIALMFNNVSSWKLEISALHPLAKEVSKPGAGIVVSTDQGTIISGLTQQAEFKTNTEDPTGILTISGVDDNIFLYDQYAYPDPANNAENQTKVKDTRSGNAETVMKAFVRNNIGPDAISSRKISNLLIETNLNRGPLLTKSARWKRLGVVLYQVAKVAELGFKIVQENDNLIFKVYEPTDLTNDLVWSVNNNTVDETVFEYNAPTVTHAIVAGEGKGVDRKMYVDTNAASLAAKDAWGRRIEVFVDAKEADTTEELKQAGDETLAQGVLTSSTEVIPKDATLSFMNDWNLGDLIKVEINEDIYMTAVIDGVAIVLNEDGITIKASINKSNRKDPLGDRVSNLEGTAEGSLYKRATLSFTTPSLAPDATWKGEVSIASGYRILKVQANQPSRLRLYADTAGQNADEIRPVTGYPEEQNGLQLDFVFTDFLLQAVLNPTVDGWTVTGSANVPVSVTNKTNTTRTITITMTYIRTE